MPAPKSKSEVTRKTTISYLQTLDPNNPPHPDVVTAELLNLIEQEFDLENAVKTKGRKWDIPTTLLPAQIADILNYLHPICKISCAGTNANSEYDLLALYQPDGPDEGIYVTDEDTFYQLSRQYNYYMTTKDFNEIMKILKGMVSRKQRCLDKDLIAVNNGIFDYKTKTLLPFSPDLVFLTKSRVNYITNPVNPLIHNPDDNTDWDIESWMSDLSDDPEIVETLWQILGAIIRPNVRWNKSAWFYSETGNNGKGTLCELMRNLCGDGSYASISIADFSKDFMLEPLTRASAVIVDENDVGTFIDRAANLKAVITNDVIQINRKFKTPIAYQFYGFMVQCLNEFPRIRDRSDSFYRRQLFIPFDKCFTGRERTYIKNDYLHRPAVLEYVLHKVLHMDYYKLNEPEACKAVLNEYKEFNDPIRQFFEEISEQLIWDLVPFTFLYELYKAWYRKNAPCGSPQSRNTFINDILNVLSSNNDWYCDDKTKLVRIGDKMDKPEPLIVQYGLLDWQNPHYHGNDINQICKPVLASGYRGIQRYTNTKTTTIIDEDDNTNS